MFAFLLVLPPLLWATAVLTDKMLVDGDGEDSKPGALMAISGFFNLIVACGLGAYVLLTGGAIDILAFVVLATNGVTQVCAMLIFLTILKEDDVSRIDPWFQTVPIFGAVGAYLAIGQLPAWYQMLAIILVLTGGLVLSVGRRGLAGGRIAALALTSCGLLAINDVVFAKFGMRFEGEMTAIFADVCGKAFWGLSLLALSKTYRKGFVVGLRTKFKLQSFSEIFAIAADFFFDWGKLLFPVAIMQATTCTQSMFTLIGALILTKYGLLHEETSTMRSKVGGILLVIIGGLILAITVT